MTFRTILEWGWEKIEGGMGGLECIGADQFQKREGSCPVYVERKRANLAKIGPRYIDGNAVVGT